LSKPHVSLFIPFLLEPQPNGGQGRLILEVYRSRTMTHHSRLDSSGRVIAPSPKPLLNNIQHSQQTDIHTPCGIQTRNPSKRSAADPSLRPNGYWDWRQNHTKHINTRTLCAKTQGLLMLQNMVYTVTTVNG
jgi:hypothetical protein